MSLFGLFNSKKPAGQVEERDHSLIASDWDRVKNGANDLRFLTDYTIPVFWIYVKDRYNEKQIKELTGTTAYEIKKLLGYEIRLSLFIINSLLYEYFTNEIYEQIIFVVGDNYLEGSVKFLREHDVHCDIKIFSGGKDRGGRASSPRSGRDSPRDSNKDRSGRGNKREPQSKPDKPPEQAAKELAEVCREKIPLNESQTLSRLGHLVKSATGLSVTQLIGQKGNRLLIDKLIEDGYAEAVDQRTFRMLKHFDADAVVSLIKSGEQQRRSGGAAGRSSGGGRGGSTRSNPRPSGQPPARSEKEDDRDDNDGETSDHSENELEAEASSN